MDGGWIGEWLDGLRGGWMVDRWMAGWIDRWVDGG